MELRKLTLLGWFVLCFCSVKAQSQLNSFLKAYETYKQERPTQQLYFTFNQGKYVPGDTVFFKAYLVGEDLSLWSSPQIVEINLIDAHGSVSAHALIKTEKGVASNQIILPSNLKPGFYNFTAFTNWMRNFGVSSMFQAQLSIVGEAELDHLNDKIEYGIEGGNLIDGVVSDVVIRCNKADSWVYLNDHLSRIDSVKTDMNGLGKFTFRSDKAKRYSINAGDTVVNLPMVQENGYNVSLVNGESNDEAVKILVSGKPDPDLYNLYFIITSKGKVVYAEALPADQLKVGKSISREKLTSGLYHISLLSESGELISFREFFLPSVEDLGISINTTGINSTVQDLKLTIETAPSVSSELSVRILNQSVLENETLSFEEKIVLSQRIINEGYHKLKPNDNVIDQMLILKPKTANWDNILEFDGRNPQYGFSSLLQKIGVAKDSLDNPLPVHSTLMFYLQNDLMRYEVDVLEQGMFALNLFDVFGEEELFVMAETPTGEELLNINIDWIAEPLPRFLTPPKAKESNRKDAYGIFAGKRQRINDSFKFFSDSVNLDSLANSKKSRAPKVPILEADETFNVEDFYLFPTFSEFINEVVRPLRVGKFKGKPVVRVRFLEPNIATADPLYIIDGIATKNTNFFLSLDPKTLKQISVIKYPKKLSRFGEMAKNGVVLVETKSGTTRQPINENKLFTGISRGLPFAKIRPNKIAPQFRSTLYWNPSVETDENGSATIQFYSSDDVAPMLIRIEGFVNGKPFSVIKQLENAAKNNH